MYITIFAAGALVASLWWLMRMRRWLAEQHRYVNDLEQMNDQADRILRQDAKQIQRLLKELHDIGHPRFQDPEFHPAVKVRQKGATR